ncbi:uncharacterized protein LOC117236743 [Bombus vosnesenskii]|uniref:Uncharacterized protein LOC117236743 n=1 Tax=Bombus vosnesenskii TaxID=207650 RepID=A0A6J3KVE3_9HYME|nr:uncharacterized protein LOC117236743 [Bombus vosnesenskii]
MILLVKRSCPDSGTNLPMLRATQRIPIVACIALINSIATCFPKVIDATERAVFRHYATVPRHLMQMPTRKLWRDRVRILDRERNCLLVAKYQSVNNRVLRDSE